jgi:hypothetical protein
MKKHWEFGTLGQTPNFLQEFKSSVKAIKSKVLWLFGYTAEYQQPSVTKFALLMNAVEDFALLIVWQPYEILESIQSS